MRRFSHFLCRARWPVVAVMAVTGFEAVEGRHFTESWAEARRQRRELVAAAERLGVPVERLARPLAGGGASGPVQSERLAAVLERAAAVEASNPFQDRIEAVKEAHRAHRLEAALAGLDAAVTGASFRGVPPAGSLLPESPLPESRLQGGSVAEGLPPGNPLRGGAPAAGLRADLEVALELPPLPEGLPGAAQRRHRRMQERLRAAARAAGPILELLEGGKATGEGRAAAAAGLAAALDRLPATPRRDPARPRPLPLQRVARRARTVPGPTLGLGAGSPRAPDVAAGAAAPGGSRHPEIEALAESLGRSPARIFAWMHDTVRLDPKWGQVRSPVGTLLEARGTAWDQALLLRELLAAAGVEARVEWGEVEVPASLLAELVGTDDPIDAGDLLATAGTPIVLQTRGAAVESARFGHVWVRAHLDYFPDRGVRPGPPDAWIRMDPSLKRRGRSEGIDVHRAAPFDLGAFLRSGSELSPRRYWEEELWRAIREQGIVCTSLSQLSRGGGIVREAFPIVPGTLRGRIVRIDGEGAEPPPEMRHRLGIEIAAAGGEGLLSWEMDAPALWGRTLEVAWEGASDDDRAILAAFGGVFETPPYLVELRPSVRLDGVSVAEGSALGSAREAEIRITIGGPGGDSATVRHDTLAGEQHAVAVDLGALPARLVAERQDALLGAMEAGGEAEVESATLQLLGATYLHRLGRDLEELSAWSWHRPVRLGTAGLVTRGGVVAGAIGGLPLAFRREARSLDVSRLALGLVPADGDDHLTGNLLRLLGAQSSHLEGEVFDRVLRTEGIAAVSALTRSVREGQELTRVDAANLSEFLERSGLSREAEERIRAAIGQGRVAWAAERPVTVNRWTGTGYVLEEPRTGAAAHLITGGLAGGSETGDPLLDLEEVLGSEPWLRASPLGDLVESLKAILGAGAGGGDPVGGPGRSPPALPGGDPAAAPGPRPGARAPASLQSDPVNLASGNLWLTATDLRIGARGLPVVWQRSYNSRSRHAGPLGYGWTFSYDEELIREPDGAILYREADGSEHRFPPAADGGYEAPPGKRLVLTEEGVGFGLRTVHGALSRFSADGRLQSVSDPNGNRVELVRAADGSLEAVYDAAGRRALSVESSGGRIRRIVDLAGRSVAFGYTGDDLTAVTDVSGGTWSYVYDEEHNLVARVDPLGQTHSYAYDGFDRCIRHVDPLGGIETFSYAAAGRAAVLTDRLGHDRYFEFDERGRAVLEVDPHGNAYRAAWNADNRRVSTTDPRGGVTTRSFDGEGRLLAETDPSGATTRFAYEPGGHQVASITDAEGHVVEHAYDAAGNLIGTSRHVGEETVAWSVTYDPLGRPVEIVDANGGRSELAWDPESGALGSRTDPLGHRTTLESDTLGRLVAARDPAGNATLLAWDESDRLRSMTDPHGNTISIEYDPAGRPVRVSSPRGASVTEYDAAGRPVATIDPLGNVRRREYDAAGRLVARVDARGNRTLIHRDALGRPVALVDPAGGVWSYGYCAEQGSTCAGPSCGATGGGGAGGVGDFCDLTDPLGRTIRRTLDAAGRVVAETDPLGNTVQASYDLLGRRTSVRDPLGNVTRFEYDSLDRLTAVVEADGSRTRYRYDGNGNLVGLRDAEGMDWVRAFDPLGRLVATTDPLGNTERLAYDPLGNLVRRSLPDGRSILYEYDVRRLTAVRLPDGRSETFTYDALGRRTGLASEEAIVELELDALDRTTRRTDRTLGRTVSFTYDGDGRLVRMAGPRGETHSVYDAAGRLVERSDPAAGTFRFVYNAAGERTAVVYPSGAVTEYAYDPAGRLTSVISRDAAGRLLDGHAYELDAAGGRVGMTGLGDGVEHRYHYDENRRLVRWQRGAVEFEEYAYDRTGNRLLLSSSGGEVGYEYDAAGRLVRESRRGRDGSPEVISYLWDESGRLLERASPAGSITYRWDALGRLLGSSGGAEEASYGYDARGDRVRETVGGRTRRLLLADEDVIAAYDAGGGLADAWAHGPGVDEPLARVPAGGGEPVYLHADGLGSITAASSPGGRLVATRSYSPFGEQVASSGPEGRYGFAGREAGPGDLLYFRARYLQPAAGRFISADPFPGAPAVPASLNRYVYALNDPVARTDPFGLAIPNLALLGAVGVLSTFAFALVAFILGGIVHILDSCASDRACLDAVLQSIPDTTLLIPLYSLVAVPMLLLIEGVLPPLVILLLIVSMYLGLLLAVFGQWLQARFSPIVAGSLFFGVSFGVNWAWDRFVRHAVELDERRQRRLP